MHRYILYFYRWLGILNDLLLIPMFAIIVIQLSQQKGPSAFYQQDLILNGCFFLEWVLGLYLAESRKRYLLSFPKILDFISCLPWGFTQIIRLARMSRVLKIIRLVTRAKRYSGPGKELLRVASLVGATIFAGAYSILVVEPGNPQIQNFSDALWWSLVTVSTVGYGDITPDSAAGRLIAAPLIAIGVGVCGYVAGFMSRIMSVDEELDNHRMQSIEKKLDRLSAQLDGQIEFSKNNKLPPAEPNKDSSSLLDLEN